MNKFVTYFFLFINWSWCSLFILVCKVNLTSNTYFISTALTFYQFLWNFIRLRAWLIPSITSIYTGKHFQSLMYFWLRKSIYILWIYKVIVWSRIVALLMTRMNCFSMGCLRSLIVFPTDPKSFSLTQKYNRIGSLNPFFIDFIEWTVLSRFKFSIYKYFRNWGFFS